MFFLCNNVHANVSNDAQKKNKRQIYSKASRKQAIAKIVREGNGSPESIVGRTAALSGLRNNVYGLHHKELVPSSLLIVPF